MYDIVRKLAGAVILLFLSCATACGVDAPPAARDLREAPSSDAEHETTASVVAEPPPAVDTTTAPAEAPDETPEQAADDPGPPPPGCQGITKDHDGFFRRWSGKSQYVGYVPASYTGSPSRLVVGLHGCGDDAYNFATWGVNPWKTRPTQDWIGVSIDGASGGHGCWASTDEAKVLAAIDDVAKCFYVHKKKIVLAGFSSGGILAYSVGLRNASRFAGILAENTALYATGDPNGLLAAASWKIRVAHLAHRYDEVFPLARVQGDWSAMKRAGFPVETTVVGGGHDGTSDDWTDWLLPKMATWSSP